MRALVVLAIVFISATVFAQESTTTTQPAPAPAPAKPAAAAASPVKLKVGGYVHADARVFLGDEEKLAADQFLLRRVRPDLQGVILDHYEFRILADFASSRLVIQDAYVEVNHHPAFRVRLGKFKPPVGLERLQSATSMEFVERALPTNLVPNRDIGLQLHGEVAWISYQVGLFNGVADAAVGEGDITDDKEVAARVFAHLPVPGTLGIGGAFTYGDKKGTLAAPEVASFRTTGQATFFAPTTGAMLDATTVASGTHVRATGQGYYYIGPVGLLGEYIFSSVEVARGTTAGKIEANAFQAQASFVLTGEDASFKGVSPKSGFDPAAGTWGAFEVAARFHQLNVRSAAFEDGFADINRSARKAVAFGGGARWYFNKYVKLVLDFEHTSFTGGAAAGADRPAEDVLLTRLATVF